MSKFLAPIHTTMLDKIKTQEQLEVAIALELTAIKGEEFSDLWNTILIKYGSILENKPIEELIDLGNIHGWLQDKITRAELRQAAIITEVINKYGMELMPKIESVFLDHSTEKAREADDTYELDSPETMFLALNKYILEGMPCDNASSVKAKSATEINWVAGRCLHKKYWDEVGGDVENFYNLRNLWVKTFVEATGNYIYAVERQETESGVQFSHKISKK